MADEMKLYIYCWKAAMLLLYGGSAHHSPSHHWGRYALTPLARDTYVVK